MRCGPTGMPAAAMTTLTWRQAVVRPRANLVDHTAIYGVLASQSALSTS